MGELIIKTAIAAFAAATLIALTPAAAEEQEFYTSAELLAGKMQSVGCDPMPQAFPYDNSLPRDEQPYSETERDTRHRLVSYCGANALLKSFIEDKGDIGIAELMDFQAHEGETKQAILAVSGVPADLVSPEQLDGLSIFEVADRAIQAVLNFDLRRSYSREGYDARRVLSDIERNDDYFSAWAHNKAKAYEENTRGYDDQRWNTIGKILVEATAYRPRLPDVINALRAVPEDQIIDRNLMAREAAVSFARVALDHAFEDRLDRHPALRGYYEELSSLLDQIPTGLNSPHYAASTWNDPEKYHPGLYGQAIKNYKSLEQIHQRAYEIRLELERREFRMSYQQGAQAVAMAAAVGDPGFHGNPPGVSRDERDWIALDGAYEAMRHTFFSRGDYRDRDTTRAQVDGITTQVITRGIAP